VTLIQARGPRETITRQAKVGILAKSIHAGDGGQLGSRDGVTEQKREEERGCPRDGVICACASGDAAGTRGHAALGLNMREFNMRGINTPSHRTKTTRLQGVEASDDISELMHC
jgi:hypothetical protein